MLSKKEQTRAVEMALYEIIRAYENDIKPASAERMSIVLGILKPSDMADLYSALVKA